MEQIISSAMSTIPQKLIKSNERKESSDVKELKRLFHNISGSSFKLA
jgi:hypothetical protein